jgi:Zn-dependent protease with chaperone function
LLRADDVTPPPKLPLRHPYEIPTYVICVALNLLIAVVLVVATVDVERLPDSPGKVVGLTILIVVLLVFPILVVGRYLLRASTRANTVQSSPTQFPQLHAIKSAFAERLGFARGKEPELYVQAGNGTLNAFAAQARIPFTVIYSDLFANTLRDNTPALSFIIGHELAHIRCWHTRLWYQLAICWITYVPLVGPYLSRLRELSCDRNGAYLAPDGASGLVLLSAGRYVYHEVRLPELLAQARTTRGVWYSLGQLPLSHPFTLRRLAALYRLGLFAPPTDAPSAEGTVAGTAVPRPPNAGSGPGVEQR